VDVNGAEEGSEDDPDAEEGPEDAPAEEGSKDVPAEERLQEAPIEAPVATESYDYTQCVTKESVIIAFVTFMLVIVIACTASRKVQWTFAIIVASLTYDIALRVTGIRHFIADEGSSAKCSSVMCSGLQGPLKCVVGDGNKWTIEVAECVISMLAFIFCLSEPIAYFVFDNVPKTLMRYFRLTYAATFALLSFTAILMRTTIFKHLSAFSGDPKVMLFFLRPVFYFICLGYIEYGASLCLLNQDESVLQHYFGNFQRACLVKMQALNQWYVQEFVSKEKPNSRLLKSSNTAFTYASAVLVGILLLVLNFLDPITGRGGIQHQILQAFWLDFDIIINLSGPLTLLFIVAVYVAWLANGSKILKHCP
jgi:hypothetical protein